MLESPVGISKNRLGEPVSWTLRVVGPGTLALGISINYERSYPSPQGQVFMFTNASAPPVTVVAKP